MLEPIATKYDESMKEKIAVSLPADLVAAARAAVRRGDAASVSAYVADALQTKAAADSWTATLEQMDLELGAPTAEDESWARTVLGL